MFTRRTLLTAMLLFVVGILPLAAQRPDFAANHYFVGFREPITANDTSFLQAQAVQIRWTFGQIRTIEIVVRSAAQLAAIQRNSRVEFVEEVPMRYAESLSTEQLVPSPTNGLYGLVTSKAVNVHSLGHTGAGVKVGVADTAIDCTHVDIAANLKESVDMVGDRSHGGCWKKGDVNEEHATHVSGIVAGVFNSAGIYGTAYNASLYHARVLGPQGGTSGEVMAGVDHLVNVAGVRVVNLSLGGGFPSIAEARFYRQIRDEGVLVVAATGNNGRDRVSYPAAYAPNIAVGAVDSNNAIADFSQTGRNIDIVGPGVSVLSSVPVGRGSEAFVSAGRSNISAIGLQYAGKTPAAGVTGTLVNCGMAVAATDCPATVFGNVALIQRGTNSFGEKVANAMTAGATAAIIYNNAPGNFSGTVCPDPPGDCETQPWIPAVSVSDTDGAFLVTQVGTSVTVVNMLSNWDIFSGTSMATPHVAGVVALMWGAAPSLTNDQIEANLLSTATDLGAAGYDTTFGYGLVNALAAVQASAPAVLVRR
jgi:subtilisin family serine protease